LSAVEKLSKTGAERQKHVKKRAKKNGRLAGLPFLEEY